MNIKAFFRRIANFLNVWYHSLDKCLFWGVAGLILFGMILTFSASPAVASRVIKSKDSFHFIKKQLIFLAPTIGIILGMSMLSIRWIKRVSLAVFVGSIVLCVLVLIFGESIKGGTRWFQIFGLTIQPSEFLKPSLAVVGAVFFEKGLLDADCPGARIATGLWFLCALLVFLQPDIGMTTTITAIWGCQLFLAGLPIKWVFAGVGLGAGVAPILYCILPHVRKRIDGFLFPEKSDVFQVKTALEALHHGGWFGRGPGEGIIQLKLPDAHTDFILAVAAEEYGFLISAGLVILFFFVLMRGLFLIFNEKNLFIMLAIAGLLTQFGLQALINMASTLHLMPTKGMTLPFISYGGSSLLSFGFCFGIILALTRRERTL